MQSHFLPDGNPFFGGCCYSTWYLRFNLNERYQRDNVESRRRHAVFIIPSTLPLSTKGKSTVPTKRMDAQKGPLRITT